jgi:DinB superfamily
MKTVKILVLLPALLLLSFKTPAPGITDAERTAALKYLETTKADFLKSIKGLSAAQLNFKASSESWSIAECAEHIAITETNLFGMIQGTLKEPANPAKRSEVKITDETVFAVITDRSYKVKTQDFNLPVQKFGSHDGTVKEFLAKREATMNYLKSTNEDLRNHYFTFEVAALGTVDSYQLFIFLAGHSKRHILQIEEVKANANFPKK